MYCTDYPGIETLTPKLPVDIIRAPLPNSPKLQVKPSFLAAHNLFYYSDPNTALSEAAVARFCLDQCIAYQPNPDAVDLFSNGTVSTLPLFYVTNKPGPCLSFTVDLGKPFPPIPNDTAPRWFCEGFDRYLAGDLSDFEPVDAPGSFRFGLAVNRACGGGYRAF